MGSCISVSERTSCNTYKKFRLGSFGRKHLVEIAVGKRYIPLSSYFYLATYCIVLLLILPVLFLQLTEKDVYLWGVKYCIIVVIVP